MEIYSSVKALVQGMDDERQDGIYHIVNGDEWVSEESGELLEFEDIKHHILEIWAEEI